MSTSSSFLVAISLALFMVTSTFGHSQMRCAKYDKTSGKCLAPIRDAENTFLQERNIFNGGGSICQSRMTNPISAAYTNAAPMGSIAQGETFTVMWLARNHAVADQKPGNIVLYVSSNISMNQGMDVSTADFELGRFCESPYTNCENGENKDMTKCFATCTMPKTTAVGIHTVWWKWDWRVNDGNIYTTCADIYVTGSTGGSTPSTPSTTPSSPVNTPSAPSTTAAAAVKPPSTPSTTGAKPATPSTTGAMPATPSTPSTTGARPVIPVSTTGKIVTSVPSSTNTDCILGSQVCSSKDGTQYQTCTNGRESNYWAAPQTCSVGTVCKPSTNPLSLNKIYCVRP